MGQDYDERFFRHRHDAFISALAFGGFLVIVGLVFVLNQNLWQQTNSFFKDITNTTVHYPIGSSSTLVLPAPANPGSHSGLYNSVLQFDVGMGLLQILILGLRLGRHSWVRRIAGTVGNLVFWFGAAFLVNDLLLIGTQASWFEYWAAIIVLLGVSLVARAAIYFARR